MTRKTKERSPRRKDDAYMTPRWCAGLLSKALKVPDRSVAVEPCVGSGNILAAFPLLDWISFDIRPATVGDAVTDFLKLLPVDECAAVAYVITNPPYSLAEEFIRHARALFPRAQLAFLLRLSFLGSVERLQLWADVGAPDLHILPNRPSFVDGEHDNSEYAWFVFPPDVRAFGHVRVLPDTPLDERRKG